MSGLDRHAAIFDSEVLDLYTGGDTTLRNEVLRLFLGQARVLFGRLQSAVGEGRAWTEAAHSLKGCARSVGANTLADLAIQAEGTTEASQQSETLRALEQALESTASRIEALLNKA